MRPRVRVWSRASASVGVRVGANAHLVERKVPERVRRAFALIGRALPWKAQLLMATSVATNSCLRCLVMASFVAINGGIRCSAQPPAQRRRTRGRSVRAVPTERRTDAWALPCTLSHAQALPRSQAAPRRTGTLPRARARIAVGLWRLACVANASSRSSAGPSPARRGPCRRRPADGQRGGGSSLTAGARGRPHRSASGKVLSGKGAEVGPEGGRTDLPRERLVEGEAEYPAQPRLAHARAHARTGAIRRDARACALTPTRAPARMRTRTDAGAHARTPRADARTRWRARVRFAYACAHLSQLGVVGGEHRAEERDRADRAEPELPAEIRKRESAAVRTGISGTGPRARPTPRCLVRDRR